MLPEYWYDEDDPKEDWPEAAGVGGLIQSCSPARECNDDTTGEGVEIPDGVLGLAYCISWMESWSEPVLSPGMENFAESGCFGQPYSPAMVEYILFNGPQGKYPSKADLSYAVT